MSSFSFPSADRYRLKALLLMSDVNTPARHVMMQAKLVKGQHLTCGVSNALAYKACPSALAA